MRAYLLLAIAALLVAAPPAGAQSSSTPTTLYFHIFDTFNKFPINTQPMDVDFFEVGGTNFPTLAANGYDFNTIYGYSTAGPVEYEFIENGRPRFHPEHGIAADVLLDESVRPVVYLYVDVRDVIAGDDGPMILPAYTFEVTVRTGDDPGDTSQLDAGDLLMHGKMTAHIADGHALPVNDVLAGQEGPDGHAILVPDAEGIVEYAIPLEVSQWTIPKAEAYNVRIDWYQDPSGENPDQFAAGWMRLAADAAHLPRMELAVKNPVYVEFVHPQVAAGTLLIHTGINSPWGTYDLDMGNLSLVIDGPAEPQTLQRFVSQGVHVHDLHDKAAEVTYMWPFRSEGAPNGEYAIQLTVPNLAGTATATATAAFTVEGKRAYGTDDSGNVVEPADEAPKKKDSPGLGLLAPLALSGVAAARRWRA